MEIRVTFSGNADSEIALVLMLDTPDQMAERKEVVLRNWGQEVRVEADNIFYRV